MYVCVYICVVCIYACVGLYVWILFIFIFYLFIYFHFYFYFILIFTSFLKGAKSIKNKDTSTTAVKESTKKYSNDQDNFSSINLETYKEPSQTPLDTTSEKSNISPPKKTTPKKGLLQDIS